MPTAEIDQNSRDRDVRRLREELHRRNRLLEASGDGFWEWDPYTESVWFSPRWKANLGFGPDELPDALDAWKGLIESEDAAIALADVPRLRSGEIDRYEHLQRFRHRDGRRIWMLGRAVADRDETGRLNRIYGTHTDVTDLIEARQRAQTEEARFASLAKAVPGVLYQWQRSAGEPGRFTYVSPLASEILGVDPNALLRDWRALRIHPDDQGRFGAAPADAGRSECAWRFEGRYMRADGEVRWLRAMSRAAPSGPEAVVFNGVLLDITEERRRQQALEESERLFREMAEAVPQLVSFIDDDLRCVFVNHACDEAFGVPPRQLEGRYLGEILDPAVWKTVEPKLRRCLRGEQVSFDSEGELDDGSPFAFRATYIPARQGDDQVPGLYAIIQDLREFRQREFELRQAHEEAEKASRAKNSFLATMSHELRTPLNAVIGYAELIERALMGPVSDRYRDYARDIRRSGVHLLDLLNDILDLSRIEAGGLEVTEVDIRLDRVVRDVAGFFRPLDQQRLRFDLPPTTISGDERAARQIFINLISNALKFSDQTPVEIGQSRRAKELRITVRDHGPGIRARDLPRLGTPFWRGSASPMRSGPPGSGIGLSIVKRLSAAMSWHLEFANHPEGGLVASVVIPDADAGGTGADATRRSS